MPPFIKAANFSDVILVLNYHGCKGEAINLISHCLIDISHKTVTPSFSDWSLIKQIIVFPTTFVLGKTRNMKGCILEANLEEQGWFTTLFTILLVLTWGLRCFWKRGNIRKGFVEIEDWRFSVHFALAFQ